MTKEDKDKETAAEIRMVICDNSLNRYGWRLLVEGIQLDNFKKNPICCLEHDTWRPPIGKWSDVHVEGDKLVGTLHFDENDPEAMKIYAKYKGGYMNACSLNIRPLETSDDESMLVEGQRYSTITKSELLEVSAVTLPAQANAIKLSKTPDGGEYKLSLITKKENEMEKKEQEKIEAENAQLKEENQTLSMRVKELEEGRVADLIALHQQRGVIASDDEANNFKKLAMTDYNTVKSLLESKQAPAPAADHHEEPNEKEEEAKKLALEVAKLNAGGNGKENGKDDRSNWSYLDWEKNDPKGLHLMEQNDPKRFDQLCQSFTEDCRQNGLDV